MSQPKKTRRQAKGSNDTAMIWSIMATLYDAHRNGWTFVQLAKKSAIDVTDLLRLHKQAARGFAALRREFSTSDWPVLKEVPIRVVERRTERA